MKHRVASRPLLTPSSPFRWISAFAASCGCSISWWDWVYRAPASVRDGLQTQFSLEMVPIEGGPIACHVHGAQTIQAITVWEPASRE
jgi:hypothetical protein